jgi:hypothetical protein
MEERQSILTKITKKCISDFKVLFSKNEKPLQDAAHAFLLQKPVQESVCVA